MEKIPILREDIVEAVVFLSQKFQMKVNFFIRIILLLSIPGYASIESTLNGVPGRDRENIEFLFTFLVQRETLGFVLFGENKSVTFVSIPLTHKEYFLPYKIECGLQFQRKLKASWYVWKRHEWRFKHPNYIICEEYNSFQNEMFLQLFIIDKVMLRKTLEKYHDDFVEVLGPKFDINQFIAKLEQKKKLRPFLKKDEKLLGILLGFGREASALFRDHENLENVQPSPEYLGKRPSGCLITPVSFRGYSSIPETQNLLQAYKKEILEIEAIFKTDDFFTAALEKICSRAVAEEKINLHTAK